MMMMMMMMIDYCLHDGGYYYYVHDDEDSMVRLLAARGVERLPDPPIELPGGLEDLRQVYARAHPRA